MTGSLLLLQLAADLDLLSAHGVEVGLLVHELLVEEGHAFDLDPTVAEHVVFIPNGREIFGKEVVKLRALHMHVDTYEFFRSAESSLTINPEMRVMLHTANASSLSSIASLNRFEMVIVAETLVNGEREPALNQVLHELIVVASAISVRNPLAVFCDTLQRSLRQHVGVVRVLSMS